MTKLWRADTCIAQPIRPITVGLELRQQPHGASVERVQLDDRMRIDGFAARTGGTMTQHLYALLVGDERHGATEESGNAMPASLVENLRQIPMCLGD